MSEENQSEKDKEKTPKTKPLPLVAEPDFIEWVKMQPKPKPGDKGAEPPKDLEEQQAGGLI